MSASFLSVGGRRPASCQNMDSRKSRSGTTGLLPTNEPLFGSRRTIAGNLQGPRRASASMSASHPFPPKRFLPIPPAPCYVPPRRTADARTHHILSRFGTASALRRPARSKISPRTRASQTHPRTEKEQKNSNRGICKDQNPYEVYYQQLGISESRITNKPNSNRMRLITNSLRS